MRARHGHLNGVVPRARASNVAANDSGEVDALWSLPPDRFVAARNALAAALRAEGDPRAAEVKAMKRPAPSAWLVNALVRRAPDRIQAVFAAGDALHRAQTRVLGGADPSELHEAMRGVREAIAGAMTRARELLSESGRKPTHDLVRRVTATLRAASLDRRLREKVGRGELLADPRVDEVEALADVRLPARKVVPPKAKKHEPSKPKRVDRAAAARERERRETAARARAAELEEAAAAMEEARRAVANARAEERRARHAAENAASELERTEHALTLATERHARAKKQASARAG